MTEFKDKVIVITGASQGVGLHLAERFSLDEKSIVVLLDIQEERLNEVVNVIGSKGGQALAFLVDVSDDEQVTKAFEEIDKKFGKIDILINNAGILRSSTIEESSVQHMNSMIEVNLLGTMYCTNAAVPLMKKSGGNIINVSSILGTFPNTGSGAYGAAKAGIITLTKVWAAELSPYNIRVNAYAPGVIDTPMAEDVIKNRAEEKLKQIPLKRFGMTEDVFQLVKFFCSNNASYITGQTIGLDGGIWATQRPTGTWKV